MLKILAVGKRHDRNLIDAIEDYQKRLRAPFNAEWVLIQYSTKNGDEARQDESERLLEHIKPNDYVTTM